jgi:hypothetical protein
MERMGREYAEQGGCDCTPYRRDSAQIIRKNRVRHGLRLRDAAKSAALLCV